MKAHDHFLFHIIGRFLQLCGLLPVLIIILVRGISGKFLLHSPELRFIFVPVLHQIHLIFVERLVLQLQIHGLFHIFSQSEQQHDLIAGPDALVAHAALVVQLCQLIQPFLVHFHRRIRFQGADQLVQGRFFRLQDQVPEKVLAGIILGQVAELPVIGLGLGNVPLLQGQVRQLVKQALANGGPLKGQQQNILCLLVFLVFFIDLSDHGKQARIPHAVPVDGIRDLHGRFVVSPADHFLDLLHLYVKLIFIHFFCIS